MEYINNPELITIRADWPGNPIKDGIFQYLQDPFFPEWRTVFKMMTTPNPQRKAKNADKWRIPVRRSTAWMDERDRDFFVWLGHATFVFQLGGVRYITDPVLHSMPMVPRMVFPPYSVAALRNIDYILISHDHRDHCDKKTIKELLQVNPQAKILSTLGMDRTIKPWIGDTPLQMAGWYQRFDTPEHEPQLTFLPTRHWSRRGLFDFNEVLWGAFLFEHQGKRHYFGGDSAYQWHFKDTGKRFPGIDVALLAIGAYSPAFMMQGAHMNPEEAVQAWAELGAKRMVPMHYGTYDLSNEPVSEPLRRVRAASASAGRKNELMTPVVNQVIYL